MTPEQKILEGEIEEYKQATKHLRDRVDYYDNLFKDVKKMIAERKQNLLTKSEKDFLETVLNKMSA